MGRKRTACSRCAGIKTICSKELPCSRCKRLNLVCNYDTAGKHVSVPSLSGQGGNRVEHTRSGKGCVNCLTRRKKCDERAPICGDCGRLGLVCTPRKKRGGSEVIPSELDRDDELGPEDVSVAINPEDFDKIEPPDDHETGTSTVHNRSSTSKSDTEMDFMLQMNSPYRDWINLIEHHGAHETSRRDLNQSSAMVVLPEARVSDDAPDLGTMLPITALNNLTGVTADSLNDWSIGENHLLNHFQQVVCRALVVVDDDKNPFLLDIVPMALMHHPVRHSLVALSACHLSKVYPDFKRNELKHRSLALQGLKRELERDDRIESALATTLLLCLLEICEGNSQKWILHLHGAKALISGYTSEEPEGPLEFLMELYDFLCCITAITSMNSASPGTAFTSNIPTTYQRNETHVHPLFGIARDLYRSLNSVNNLATKRTNFAESQVMQNKLSLEAREIELSLQSWAPEGRVGDSNRLREITAAALAIQWAVLMRLHQVLHGNHTSGRKIEIAVENILSALSIIRPGSPVEAHILFPLFMAGIGSTTKSNRLTVEYRLNIMEATIGFGNIGSAHRLLDCIWQRMNEGETPDWEILMHEEYAGVVLL